MKREASLWILPTLDVTKRRLWQWWDNDAKLTQLSKKEIECLSNPTAI